MPFVDNYQKPLAPYDANGGDLITQLTNSAPALFLDDNQARHIAICLLSENLAPLTDKTFDNGETMHGVLVAKFALAVNNTNFGWCRLEKCFVFALKIPDCPSQDIHQYINITRVFLDSVKGDFGISLTASISDHFSTPAQCEAAIRDALIYVDFSNFIDFKPDVINLALYNEKKLQLAALHPEYKLNNYERPIISAILNGNYLHAELVVKKFLIYHLCERARMMPIVNTDIFYLCRLIVGLIFDVPRDAYDKNLLLRESVEKILTCGSLSEIEQHVRQFFASLQDSIASNKTQTGVDDRMRRIIEFIDKNYNTPLFSAGMVSDKFEITQAHLSRIFKEQVGINLLMYVHTLRITEAKRLLKDTDLTVEEIATNVGYIDAQNLQRLFRKYEGMTPREYRQMSRSM